MDQPEFTYYLMPPAQWETFQQDGEYCGSPLDIKDGFLHTSLASEVATTAKKFFKDTEILVLLKLSTKEIQPPRRLVLDYVEGRKAYFPHIYDGKLKLSDIAEVIKVARGNDGDFEFPDGF